MPELVTFAIAFLILLLAWRIALRKSIQDSYKDMLFDVRDTIRARFAERNQLDTPAYRSLRDTLNRYIRFIEIASFSRTFLFSFQMSRSPQAEAELLKQVDQQFALADPELARFAKWARKRCCRIIQSYVFHSSFYSVAAIYFVAVPVAASCTLGSSIRQRASKGLKTAGNRIRQFIYSREDRAIKPEHTEMLSQAIPCAPTVA